MSHKTPERQLLEHLADLSGTRAEDWFLVFKARHGMQVVFETIAESRGRGEIITQPFTCLTALNPIIDAGHIPVYIDTTPDTLSLNTEQLEASAEARAIVMQHTFGIHSNMVAAREFATAHNLLLIEDSAHAVGLVAKDSTKPVADISIHSFGVEKMLPTKFGGAVWVSPTIRDLAFHDQLVSRLSALPKLGGWTSYTTRLYPTINRFTNHMPRTFAAMVRNFLFAIRLFEPPIAPGELNGHNAHSPSLPATWMVERVNQAIASYDNILKRRQDSATLYTAALSGLQGLTIPAGVAPSDCLVRFPLLCDSKELAEELFTSLRSKGWYIGKWYRPTLFPGPNDISAYNYDPESYPVAEQCASRIINLPTNVSQETAKEIVNALHHSTIS